MGHFNETLMAVCSTPSSPFRVVFPAEAATLLKFLLTETVLQRGNISFCELELDVLQDSDFRTGGGAGVGGRN